MASSRGNGVRRSAATAVGLALCAICAASPAAAQVEEIIVTAQKRSQRLQDVPLSVTAIGGAELEGRGIRDSVELNQVTPGLVLTRNALFAQPTIRGVGTISTTAGDEPNVATYIDGVYQSQMFGNVFDFSNIERIEVLRGPQGDLFGRNASGGAIQIITRRPDFDAQTGNAALQYGRFDEVRGTAYVAAGLSSVAAADVAVLYKRDDGYVDDLVRGGRLADSETISGRSKLRLRTGGGTEFILSADATRNDDITALSSAPLANNTIGRLVNPAVLLPSKPYQSALTFEPRNRVDQYGASLTAEADLGGIDLVGISAFRHNRLKGRVDTDATPVPVLGLDIRQRSRSVSQEIRFQSDSDAFDWLAGVYAYRDESVFDPLRLTNGTVIVGDVDTQAYAAFGTATARVTDRLSLTGGLRFSVETKDYVGGVGGKRVVDTDKTWRNLSPRASIVFEATDTTNLYATYSRGFKSGVFNSAALSATPVRPEELDSFEIGVKTSPSTMFRANLSAFYYDYTNIQIQAYDAATAVSRLENAASAEMLGVDADIEVSPVDDLNFRLGLSYLDAEYRSFPRATVTVPTGRGGNRQIADDASGNEVIRAPDWTVSVGANYSVGVGRGRLEAATNLYFNSGFFWDPGNRVRQEAYEVLNVELAWVVPLASDEELRIAAWGRNLTDQLYQTTSQQSALADTVNYARPLSYGVSVGVRF